MSIFDEFIHQIEPQKREKGYAWQTAIGLRAVDGLTPSDYLLDAARKEIEGKLTIDEVEQLLKNYYQSKETHTSEYEEKLEADRASINIRKLLTEQTFAFSLVGLTSIHRRIFTGIYKFAGKIRDYNITKKEWVLRGDTVLYVPATDIRESIEYDLAQERQFNYSKIDNNSLISHISKFVSGLWQIHPFGEGNTRTTAVFTIKYLRSLGFDMSGNPFANHSWYFRNALVRANYQNVRLGISRNSEFLEKFSAICFLAKPMSCETGIWLLLQPKRRPRHTDGKSTVIKSLCRIVTIFNTMSEKGIMYAAFHRFYGALQNLQKFSIDNNLIDNIVSLDNFFSAFRSTSFVLQSSVAHTDYKTLYEEMCSERLKPNSICKWMVETRNEIEKQHPFDLSKQAFVTVYSPNSAMILKSDVFTVVNDVEYVSLVESLKDYLNKINPIEVHFSLEFKFKKLDDDTDLSSDISSAIATMKSFLFDMYAKIGETTELCEDLKSKIESLISEILKDELIFIDDYVFYGEDNRFERGQRFIPSFPKYIPVRQCAQTFGARFPTDDPKEFMKLIAKSHLEIFKAQGGNLMPTVFVVNKQNMCRVVSFDSTIRTTAYRIINDIARQVVTEKIKYVVLIHEGYLYKDFKNHNLPYDKRIEHSKGRAVVVEQVGDGFVPRAMIFDVARLSDRQYVNDMLKCKYDVKFIAQFSILKPIHQEIMLRRSSQGK